jgi:hypothetical protein
MTEAEDKSVGMVRVTVKLRPDQYDELFQYVREVGSTMSAFFRESAMTAMREAHPDTARRHAFQHYRRRRGVELAGARGDKRHARARCHRGTGLYTVTAEPLRLTPSRTRRGQIGR